MLKCDNKWVKFCYPFVNVCGCLCDINLLCMHLTCIMIEDIHGMSCVKCGPDFECVN